MSDRWYILREADQLTLSRLRPARFDVSAQTRLPLAGAVRLAHQIRQDIWRDLRRVRGFAPVIRIERRDQQMLITAGGQLAGRVPAGMTARLSRVLEDSENRQRWLRHAGPLRKGDFA